MHAGFVSNGEFNYLRSKGYTRPLSVLHVRSTARKKYSQLGLQTLSSMLTPLITSKTINVMYVMSINVHINV